jgi:quinoprotein glucose dehydrogenase
VNAPIANVANGPSGFVANPGSGLPRAGTARFFLCEFRGSSAGSGVLALRVERDGAGHRLVDTERVIWNVLATDCDFGPDGGLYVLDWVQGWGKTGRGRIYRVSDGRLGEDALAQQVATLLREGMGKRSVEELARLLGHRDRRVRQAAQFELVDRGEPGQAALEAASRQHESLFARLHAIWGLGIVARRGGSEELVKRIELLVLDENEDVRAQALRVCGEAPGRSSRLVAERALRDPSPRVRRAAVEATGRIGAEPAFGPLLSLLIRDGEQDQTLYHALVVALTRVGSGWRFADFAKHTSAAVRRAGVLTLRRLRDERVAVFLADADPSIAAEAARAIHDERILGALPALGAWTQRTGFAEIPLLRRALGAHRILGKGENLDALLSYAQRKDAPASMRVEALRIIAEWPSPHGQDRVLGEWRPLRARPAIGARVRTAPMLHALAADAETPGEVMRAALETIARLRSFDCNAALETIAADRARDGETRALALRTLAALGDAGARVRSAKGVADDAPLPLRRAALDVLAQDEPAAVVPLLASLAREGSVDERRAALASLANASGDAADAALAAELARLATGEIPSTLQLDVLEAGLARASGAARTQAQAWLDAQKGAGDPLAAWRGCLEGGDAARGERLFREHAAAQCLRCHAIGGNGGNVGPALDAIGKTRDRPYLLGALLVPNREIAAGYEQLVVKLADGTTAGGIVVRESETELVLRDADGKERGLAKAAIRSREGSGSAMPAMDATLTRRELRDLVEFLSTRKR